MREQGLKDAETNAILTQSEKSDTYALSQLNAQVELTKTKRMCALFRGVIVIFAAHSARSAWDERGK